MMYKICDAEAIKGTNRLAPEPTKKGAIRSAMGGVEELALAPLSTLFYRVGRSADHPMPAWAGFLQQIGAMASSSHAPGQRTAVAIAVPTRSFAAVLIALGAVIWRSREPVVSEDLNEHFTGLCQLPPNTKVWVTQGQQRHKGILLGLDTINGEPFLKIRMTTADSLTVYIGERNAATVEADQWEGELPGEEKGKRIVRRAGFLEAAFAGHNPRDFGTRSRVDAVIVGSAARLHAEIANTSIGARLPNGRLVYGTFQDLLRARRLAPTQAFRSEIISDTAPDFSSSPPGCHCTAVFDGARPFIKCRDAVRAASHVVVLDRTGHGFQDAADIVNQQYLRRTADIPGFRSIRGIPWGVEVMAYEEAVP
jgi:hypothetical protein